jgi:hypothetical protein
MIHMKNFDVNSVLELLHCVVDDIADVSGVYAASPSLSTHIRNVDNITHNHTV